MSALPFVLEKNELQAITGYKPAKKQLEELHSAGFYRARISPTTGAVILERAHYNAVCAGDAQKGKPTIRPPRDRRASHGPRIATQGV